MNLYRSYLKRILDILVALFLFILSFPIIILISIVLLLNLKKPFFIQDRPGKNEKIFKIIKFRTMTQKVSEVNGNKSTHVQLTSFGSFLRKYSLDEIPQLINVIKGDMSMVGPRPLLIKYLQHYSDEQRRRHQIKPGITGWAQINGRNSINWTKKFQLDVWYVENYSFILDLKIFFITIYKVLLKDGIYNSDNQIVPDFNGSN